MLVVWLEAILRSVSAEGLVTPRDVLHRGSGGWGWGLDLLSTTSSCDEGANFAPVARDDFVSTQHSVSSDEKAHILFFHKIEDFSPQASDELGSIYHYRLRVDCPRCYLSSYNLTTFLYKSQSFQKPHILTDIFGVVR